MSYSIRPAATLMVAALIFGCSDDSGDGDVPAAGTGGSPTGMAGSAGSSGMGGSGGSGGAPAVTFAADIHPILQAKCGTAGCHDRAQEPFQPGHGAADVQDAYDSTQATGVEGEPVYERILFRTTTTTPGFMMPPSYATPPCDGIVGSPGCISEEELALIEAWIEAGTPP
jgi:hypothetical protein